MGAAEKTQQRVQKNGTRYERKSTPFSIDVGTKYSLEKSYAKDEQNKRCMGTKTSYHNKKNCTMFTKLSQLMIMIRFYTLTQERGFRY